MGYDTGFPHDDVESALRELYSSCGEITDVYVPIDYQWENTLSKCSFVYFIGEGAVDKALLLNGADVGGWNVSAKAYPFQRYAQYLVSVTVKGFDTSLDEIDIENELTKIFSSCGEVTEVMVNDDSSAHLRVFGKDAVDNAPKLSGSLMGEHKVVVLHVSLPLMPTAHRRGTPGLVRCGRDWPW